MPGYFRRQRARLMARTLVYRRRNASTIDPYTRALDIGLDQRDAVRRIAATAIQRFARRRFMHPMLRWREMARIRWNRRNS